jgi:hypothetical protein
MDWSLADARSRRVGVRGRIKRIYDPSNSRVSPFPQYYTVTLYPSKGRVFYLKFQTEEELKRQSFTANEVVEIEADLKLVDQKQILTNVRRI